MTMQMTRKTLLTLAISAVVLTGCTRVRGHQGYIPDPVLISAIAPGVDNKASVQSTLGRPTFVGQFNKNEWYYVARDTKQFAFNSPNPSAQTILRVRFDEQGNVVDVNQRGLEQVAKISPDGDKTPTLGRDRSFFEDIFGNIGTVGAPGTGGGGPAGP